MKYGSRKFILTITIMALSALLPLAYKYVGVGDSVTMTVLGILAGVGTAYGFINLKAKEQNVE